MIRSKKSLQIVVVDDSDFTRKRIIETLEEEGFLVTGEANSAEKAIQIFKNTGGNLYLIDIVMPDSSGLECHH